MTVFVDTSAVVTLLEEDALVRERAAACWYDLLHQKVALITTNYVLIECAAVIQRRLGLAALRTFRAEIAPVIEVVWVSEQQHHLGVDAVILAGRRNLSVVDCVSFLVMRKHSISTAFAFDDHFREQGFTVVPEPA